MSGFHLKNEDVVCMGIDQSFTDSKTSKVEDIMDAIRDLFNTSDLPVEEWIDGIGCEVLQAADGGGWQKGILKISLCLEFIPNKPIGCQSPPSISPNQSGLSLDDLRSALDV